LAKSRNGLCENWLLNVKDCELEKRKAAFAILYDSGDGKT